MTVDVLVAGAGPAGWSLASACARLGLSVMVVAPRPLGAWRATYGLWLDEAVVLPPGSRYVTARPRGMSRWYAVLDNASVQEALRDSSVRTQAGLVREWVPGGVRLAGGEVLAARVVIDATGAPRGQVQQTAFGVLVPAAVAEPVVGPGEAVFMDWRGSTFLYAVPVADGRVLLEETSLARRPGMGMRELRERLSARLAGYGIVLGSGSRDAAVALADGAGFRDAAAPADEAGPRDAVAPADRADSQDAVAPADSAGSQETPALPNGPGSHEAPALPNGPGSHEAPALADSAGPHNAAAPADSAGPHETPALPNGPGSHEAPALAGGPGSPDAVALADGAPSGFGERQSRRRFDERPSGGSDRFPSRGLSDQLPVPASKSWPPAPGINSTGGGRQFLASCAVERVRFAVDVPAPPPFGRGAIPFGAAAGFVHPATGFSIADTFRLAPDVAAAIDRTISLGPLAVNLAARHVMWSPAARIVHRLRRWGLSTLLALPPESVPEFFGLFFALPERRQIAYLSGRDDVVGTAAAMAALYRSAPASLRRVMAGLRQTGESERDFMNSG